MQCYRRKPPSQIRDKKRAEDKKARLCPQASECFRRLFEATPEKDVCVDSNTDSSTPLLDTGYIASDTRASCADSTVLRKWWPSWWCVSTHSKPDKHSAREDVSEKYGNDQASLDPVNIVKDYVAGLMVQRRLRDTLTETTLIEE